MRPETIKAVFTNLLFVIGILLTIYGFSRGTLTVVRLAVFGKYPLYSYEESRCETDLFVPRPVEEDPADVNPQLQKDRRQACLEGLETDRKNRMVEDMTGSVTSLVAGIALTFSFRKFILMV